MGGFVISFSVTEEQGGKGVNRVWEVCSLSGKKRGEGFQCCPRE
jgi:hypothetical protein